MKNPKIVKVCITSSLVIFFNQDPSHFKTFTNILNLGTFILGNLGAFNLGKLNKKELNQAFDTWKGKQIRVASTIDPRRYSSSAIILASTIKQNRLILFFYFRFFCTI